MKHNHKIQFETAYKKSAVRKPGFLLVAYLIHNSQHGYTYGTFDS